MLFSCFSWKNSQKIFENILFADNFKDGLLGQLFIYFQIEFKREDF